MNNYVDNIINYELNKVEDKDKLICDIHPELTFKLNSFNICIGKQSTGKTTSVLKELMKLSLINFENAAANPFHLIIYVSNNDSDETFNRLKNYIKIPIVKLNYDKLDKTFEQFIKLKDKYNKFVDEYINKGIDEDNDLILENDDLFNEVQELKENLFIKNFNVKRLHTIILMDDAAFILKKESSPWFKWLCQLRHLNCIVFCCIQVWKSINPTLKSQLSSIYLFGGYSRQQLNYIYQQINLDMKFEDFYNEYTKLKKNQKIIIDMIDSSILIN